MIDLLFVLVTLQSALVHAYSTGAGTCGYPISAPFQMGAGRSGTGGFSISVLTADGAKSPDCLDAGKNYSVSLMNNNAFKGYLLTSGFGTTIAQKMSGSFLERPIDSQPASVCGESAYASSTHRLARTQNTRKLDSFIWRAPTDVEAAAAGVQLNNSIVTLFAVGVLGSSAGQQDSLCAV